jgi:MinD superfamily P-loop ATPase
MKQITVISGKGGAGKTTVTAMFATLANAVVADCDVDAPNLHILLKPKILEVIPFEGLKRAKILQDKCTQCGLCQELCRFDAIHDFEVDEMMCEGCALCYRACPEKAIEMISEKRGEIYVTETQFCDFVYALLYPGEENSGKLVSEVRNIAKKIAEEKGVDLLILDGAAGIGCPVIASLAGANLALIVTEPTLSGLNDMKRAVELACHFKVEPVVAINKFDLNIEVTQQIEEFCRDNNIEIVGRIPFDEAIPNQIAQLKLPFEGKAADEIVKIWNRIRGWL